MKRQATIDPSKADSGAHVVDPINGDPEALLKKIFKLKALKTSRDFFKFAIAPETKAKIN
jgi:hypothetical protein